MLCFGVCSGDAEIIKKEKGQAIAKYRGHQILIWSDGTKYIEITQKFLAALQEGFNTVEMYYRGFPTSSYEILGQKLAEYERPFVSLPSFNGIRVPFFPYCGTIYLYDEEEFKYNLECATMNNAYPKDGELMKVVVVQDKMAEAIVGKLVKIE